MKGSRQPRERLPVGRLIHDGRRVDIYAPRDGVWAMEIYDAEPLVRVNVQARDLETALRDAERILDGFDKLKRRRT